MSSTNLTNNDRIVFDDNNKVYNWAEDITSGSDGRVYRYVPSSKSLDQVKKRENIPTLTPLFKCLCVIFTLGFALVVAGVLKRWKRGRIEAKHLTINLSKEAKTTDKIGKNKLKTSDDKKKVKTGNPPRSTSPKSKDRMRPLSVRPIGQEKSQKHRPIIYFNVGGALDALSLDQEGAKTVTKISELVKSNEPVTIVYGMKFIGKSSDRVDRHSERINEDLDKILQANPLANLLIYAAVLSVKDREWDGTKKALGEKLGKDYKDRTRLVCAQVDSSGKLTKSETGDQVKNAVHELASEPFFEEKKDDYDDDNKEEDFSGYQVPMHSYAGPPGFDESKHDSKDDIAASYDGQVDAVIAPQAPQFSASDSKKSMTYFINPGGTLDLEKGINKQLPGAIEKENLRDISQKPGDTVVYSLVYPAASRFDKKMARAVPKLKAIFGEPKSGKYERVEGVKYLLMLAPTGDEALIQSKKKYVEEKYESTARLFDGIISIEFSSKGEFRNKDEDEMLADVKEHIKKKS